MENSEDSVILRFLVEQKSLTERRLGELSDILDNPDSCLPSHITHTLNCLRQNAEDDLSNIYHIKSIYPSAQSRSKQQFVKSPARAVSGSGLEQLEQVQESAVGQLVGGGEEDLFTLDDVPLQSVSSHYSEEEREDSEPDEGIHIPAKFRDRKHIEIAASLPVGIPWPSNLAGGAEEVRKTDTDTTFNAGGEDVARPDIAASIQAIAKSVHTSSIFGDNVFGELPRPRVNTFSKD